jgi:hypothetical protein
MIAAKNLLEKKGEIPKLHKETSKTPFKKSLSINLD